MQWCLKELAQTLEKHCLDSIHVLNVVLLALQIDNTSKLTDEADPEVMA
jgi:hypothetical protein